MLAETNSIIKHAIILNDFYLLKAGAQSFRNGLITDNDV